MPRELVMYTAWLCARVSVPLVSYHRNHLSVATSLGGHGFSTCREPRSTTGDGLYWQDLVTVQTASDLEFVRCGTVTHLVSGCGFTIAVTAAGYYPWGANDFGQLGLGDRTDVRFPELRVTAKRIITIACGTYHVMIIFVGIRGNVLNGWGLNTYNCLGLPQGERLHDDLDGWFGCEPEPRFVDITDPCAVICGDEYSLVLARGRVWLCGCAIGANSQGYAGPVKLEYVGVTRIIECCNRAQCVGSVIRREDMDRAEWHTVMVERGAGNRSKTTDLFAENSQCPRRYSWTFRCHNAHFIDTIPQDAYEGEIIDARGDSEFIAFVTIYGVYVANPVRDSTGNMIQVNERQQWEICCLDADQWV